MPWAGGTFTRTDGTRTGATVWQQARDAAVKIVALGHDTHDEDMATGVNSCINKDGSNAMTGNFNGGSKKLTLIANATSRTDAPNTGQVQDGKINWVDGGGTADAITATYSPVIAALVDGQICYVRATAANATTTPTFKPNGTPAHTIVKEGGSALVAGDIVGDGHELILRYELANTRWEFLNPGISAFNLVDDTTPQLGGALDTNSFAINESEGAAIVAATTTDIFGGDDGNTVHITGNTQIDDFTDASSIGQKRTIIFDGTPIVTSGSGITIAGGTRTAVAGDSMKVYADAVDAFDAYWVKADGTPAVINIVVDATPQLGGALDANSKAINESEGAAVASATTTDIFGGDDGNTLHITGTTTITDFTDASSVGQWRKIIFDGVLTLTHGSGITLPGSANITTAVGDYAFVYADAVDAFAVLYFRADGTAVVAVGGGYAVVEVQSASASSFITFAYIPVAGNDYDIVVRNVKPSTDLTGANALRTQVGTGGTPTFQTSGYANSHIQIATGAITGIDNATTAGMAWHGDTIGGASANETLHGVMTVFDPAANEETSASSKIGADGTTGILHGSTGISRRTTAEVVTGLRVGPGTGTITSGEFILIEKKASV